MAEELQKNTTQRTIKVAIITRTKDRPILLRRALESVTNQSFKDWIMVIVNDGGERGPVEKLVEEFSTKLNGRIKLIHNIDSIGMEAASNKGIAKCNSEYVIIHDDDDAWHKDFLQKMVAKLENADNEKISGAVCFIEKIMERIEGNKVIEASREDCRHWLNDLTLWSLCGQNLFPPISFLYKRSVYEIIGGMYDESLSVQGDWDFNLRFMRHFEITLLPEVMAYYHHRDNTDAEVSYSNTVMAEVDKHRDYNARIRNKFLRDDLKKGTASFGTMINLARIKEEHLLEQKKFFINQQKVTNLETQLSQQADFYLQQIERLEKKNTILSEENKNLKNDNKDLKHGLDSIINSTSWRIISKAFVPLTILKKFRIFLHLRNYKKAIKIIKNDGFKILWLRLKYNMLGIEACYQNWVNRYDTFTEAKRQKIKYRINKMPNKPLISIVMPVYNVEEKWLRKVIESVIAQLYQNWQLCIADDASTESSVHKILSEYQKKDDRIKVVFRKENGHISEASNSALELATGEFIALLDNDDELSEHATYMIAEAINNNPDLEMIYSDEDKIDENGKRFAPYFKPNWNPELFLSQNMFSHLGVYRKSLLDKVGGFRKGYEGSQDYDLALRCIAEIDSNKIYHIPHILYHWRAVAGSTALSNDQKDYACIAAKKSLEDYFKSQEHRAVEISHEGVFYRCKWPVPQPEPNVCLVIYGNENKAKKCAKRIKFSTDYKNLQVAFAANERELNTATHNVNADILGFIDANIISFNNGWLEEMVSQAAREEIGIVGCNILQQNNSIYSAGMVLSTKKIAEHSFQNLPKELHGYGSRAVLNQNVSAVSGKVLFIKKKFFDKVGGFDKNFGEFSNVDLCLKIRHMGYAIVYSAFAKLVYSVTESGAPNTESIQKMRQKWHKQLDLDSNYNPNLNAESADYSLAFPPQAQKPWEELG